MEQLHYNQGGELQGGSTLAAPRIYNVLASPYSYQQRTAETCYEYLAESPHGEPALYELGQLAFDFSEPCEPIPVTEGQASPEENLMTRSLLNAIVQVLDGRRRLLTIEPVLSLRVREGFKTRLRHRLPNVEPGRLLSVHTYKPTQRVIEACGTVYRGQRAQALVAQLEKRRRVWECKMFRILTQPGGMESNTPSYFH